MKQKTFYKQQIITTFHSCNQLIFGARFSRSFRYLPKTINLIKSKFASELASYKHYINDAVLLLKNRNKKAHTLTGLGQLNVNGLAKQLYGLISCKKLTHCQHPL